MKLCISVNLLWFYGFLCFYFQENIFINGLPADETREWFIKNSGYVLQLATPYHEELTVRQNLTYSAMMRLPMKMKVRDKMWRVEQVLGQVSFNFDLCALSLGKYTFGNLYTPKNADMHSERRLNFPHTKF